MRYRRVLYRRDQRARCAPGGPLSLLSAASGPGTLCAGFPNVNPLSWRALALGLICQENGW
jgi:hypothetical protein